jgi:hypothetical protein
VGRSCYPGRNQDERNPSRSIVFARISSPRNLYEYRPVPDFSPYRALNIRSTPSGRAVLLSSTAHSLGTLVRVFLRYLRAISTCFGEGDGSLAISSFISALGARNLKPMLPSSPQIWFRKYRFPKR